MTTTIASDFTYIYIVSDFITAYIAEDPTHTFTLKLLVKRNCGTEVSITLDMDSLDTDNNRYILTPDDLGMDTSLSDGVYSLVVEKTVTATGAKSYDTACRFLDVTTGCDVVDFTATNSCPDLILYHQALVFVDSCLSCDCASACTIYNYIQTKLAENDTSSGCGCLD